MDDEDPAAKSKRLLEELKQVARSISQPDAERRITVNKRTHRIRFEDETEDQVTIVIEPKGGQE
jgi:lipopolysaccharide export system protein LptA